MVDTVVGVSTSSRRNQKAMRRGRVSFHSKPANGTSRSHNQGMPQAESEGLHPKDSAKMQLGPATHQGDSVVIQHGYDLRCCFSCAGGDI